MAKLPSGTVTFLFTDIEGSTARWEHQPEAMRVALARHDAILRAAIQTHGGRVVKTMGDAFHAAFSRAVDGVAATLDGQRRLQAEPWDQIGPELGGLRVRMALHTGAAEERDGDYYGPELNRAARLLSTGHGGQTLLSDATAGLVRDMLPGDVSLLDLGEHRLKDLVRPERVFQLVAPDLRSEFPPLRSLDARPNNLPTHPTALLGRDRELAEVSALLRGGARLVTLTGPGGTGKTRLSLQVAAELLTRSASAGLAFEHGAFFVELAPISDPALIPTTIAQVLGVREAGGRPILEALKGYLRGKSLVLVLDNFEQIVAGASVISELLAASPELRVLVSSREPLQVRGEYEYVVSPLAFPDPRQSTQVERVVESPAVALFVQRAQAVRASFEVTDENAAAIAEICTRLDGLPLAIELAAARIRLLTPYALAQRLERRLPLLVGGARDLPTRQQTLRDTIAWSHDLLDQDERRLFRRLAVFVGGWTLDAVEAVCNLDGDLGIDVLDGVTSLVAKSLLRGEEAPNGELRFGMLATIREFAFEQLEVSGELPSVREQHRDHFLAVAEAAKVELTGRRQAEWFDRVERETDNLRTALEWSCAEGDLEARAGASSAHATAHVMAGIRLVDALERYWVVRGHGRENLPRLMALVGFAPRGTAARAQILTVAGHVCTMLGDYQMALPLADEALATWRALGDAHGTAVALARRGQLAFWMSDHRLTVKLVGEARDLFHELGGESVIEVPTVLWLAEVAHAQGDHDRALMLYDEALAEARARGDSHAVAAVLRELARLRRTQGSDEQAVALLREGLTLLEPLKDVRCAQTSLEALAGVLCEHGRPSVVARLFGAAEALRELWNRPLTLAQLVTHDRDVATVEHQLDAESFATALAEGRAMSLERAVAYALEETSPP